MNLFTKIAALIFASASIAANGEDSRWVKIGDNPKFFTYYDSRSVVVGDGWVSVWVMRLFKEPYPVENDSGKKYSSTKSYDTYRCKERTSANATFIKYGPDSENEPGVIIYSNETPKEKMTFSNVIPDSVGEADFFAVCDISKIYAAPPKKTNKK